jgi:hypothetical protein
MGEYTIERSRHARELQRVDEQPRVADLPAAVGADETPKLLLAAPSSPGGLLLEDAERSKLTLGLDDLFHTGGTQAADQLVLQVGDAHIEPEGFHVGATEVGAEAGPLQTTPDVALLAGVTQARQAAVQAPRTEPLQEVSDVAGTAHRDDGDALGGKLSTTALGKRLERDLIAYPLNKHDGLCLESLLVVHLPSLVLEP